MYDHYYMDLALLDPVITFQQSSYSFNESTPEMTGDICVTLEGPAGGLSESFQVNFEIVTSISRPASKLVIICACGFQLLRSLQLLGWTSLLVL